MQTVSRHTENLSAITNPGNAIQNHGKGSLYSGGMAITQRQKGLSAGEGVEKKGCTVGGDVN